MVVSRSEEKLSWITERWKRRGKTLGKKTFVGRSLFLYWGQHVGRVKTEVSEGPDRGEDIWEKKE